MNFKIDIFLGLFLILFANKFESVRCADDLKLSSRISVSGEINIKINDKQLAQLIKFDKEEEADSCGMEKVKGQYPWLAAVMTKSTDTDWNSSLPFCTGTIIDKQFVMTTARCIHSINSEMDPNSMTVRLGAGRLSGKQTVSDPSQEFQISKIKTHEDYTDSLSLVNDIALIKLTRKIKASENVGPICLGEVITGDLKRQKVKAIGWSRETSKGYPMGTLFQTDLPVMSNTQCNQIYRRLENGQVQIENPMVCTNGWGQAFCRSDSGAPLMIKDKSNRWTLIAVTIFLGCPLDGYPGISTKVPDFNAWIKKNIKNM